MINYVTRRKREDTRKRKGGKERLWSNSRSRTPEGSECGVKALEMLLPCEDHQPTHPRRPPLSSFFLLLLFYPFEPISVLRRRRWCRPRPAAAIDAGQLQGRENHLFLFQDVHKNKLQRGLIKWPVRPSRPWCIIHYNDGPYSRPSVRPSFQSTQ